MMKTSNLNEDGNLKMKMLESFAVHVHHLHFILKQVKLMFKSFLFKSHCKSVAMRFKK